MVSTRFFWNFSYPPIKLVGLNSKAFSHGRICAIAIGIGGNETNRPEDEDKDQGTDGQHEGGEQVKDVVATLDLLHCLLVLLSRFDIDHIHPFATFEKAWWARISESTPPHPSSSSMTLTVRQSPASSYWSIYLWTSLDIYDNVFV